MGNNKFFYTTILVGDVVLVGGPWWRYTNIIICGQTVLLKASYMQNSLHTYTTSVRNTYLTPPVTALPS